MADQRICYDFRDNGNCRFADRCRFAHGGAAPAGGAGPADGGYAPRRAFGGGFGGAGAGAGAPRVCYDFRDNGNCKFGDGCRFQHGDAAPAPRQYAPRQGGAPAGGAGVCYTFKNTGACRYGDNCRFSHQAEAPQGN